MSPAIHPVSENGLPNLLGARRAYRPIVFVEPKARVLERQAAILEQPAHLGFGVVDHRFVENAVNAARQHGIDMGHQLHVVAIVAADVIETIGEILAAREMLLESGEAAAERDGAARR